VPQDLVTPYVDYETLLGDPRMEARPDPFADTPRLIPSCLDPARGLAYPPTRLVQVAKELDERGAATSVQSICSDDYTEAVNGILARVAESLAGSCQ